MKRNFFVIILSLLSLVSKGQNQKEGYEMNHSPLFYLFAQYQMHVASRHIFTLMLCVIKPSNLSRNCV